LKRRFIIAKSSRQLSPNRVLQDPKQKRLFSQRDLRDLFTLKSDDGSVIQGGQGVTELGTITKGQGVIHPEAIAGKSRGDDDDGDDDMETLETVMKSKGLAGVFDHDFVDRSDINKSLAVREMEEQAAKVAAEAVKALKASTSNSRDRFQPTYTGSEETAAGRFGHGNFVSRKSCGVLGRNSADRNFGSAGISQRDGATPTSSKSLLAGLKGMQTTPDSSTAGSTDVDATTTSSYAALLQRIRVYLQRCGGYREGGGPTTDEVLKEFDDVPPNDAAIFRRLLKSVANVERGRWRLTT
jgi:DNA excision repair protein ERCC-6